ncbi:MAG: hypothetical protein ACRDJE_01595 [Dehalococcoidia bacterium]
MMIYKACPKCGGDLGVERDLYGGPPDLVCIQCGYTARPHERMTLVKRAMQRSSPRLVPAYAAPAPARRAS